MTPNTRIGRAVLLYDQVGTLAAVAASSEAVGSPAANATDGLTYDAWQAAATGTHDLTLTLATPVAVDCIGITGHNLNGGSVRVQGSNDGGVFTDLLPGTSKLIDRTGPLLLFLPRPVAYSTYRIKATHATVAPRIAVVGLGQQLKLQRGQHDGYAPPNLNPTIEYSTTETEGGNFAGRSVIRVNAELDVNLDTVTEQWLREHWQPFVTASRSRGFWFLADAAKRPTDVFFGYTTAEPGATHDKTVFMSTRLRARGVA